MGELALLGMAALLGLGILLALRSTPDAGAPVEQVQADQMLFAGTGCGTALLLLGFVGLLIVLHDALHPLAAAGLALLLGAP